MKKTIFRISLPAGLLLATLLPVFWPPAQCGAQNQAAPPRTLEEHDSLIRERMSEENKWLKWRKRLEKELEKAERAEKSSRLKPLDKAGVWASLLKEFDRDNPFSRVDEAVRDKARSRKIYWTIVQNGQKASRGPMFTNSLGMQFVLIPAGTFTMGSSPYEQGRGDYEAPRQRVTISQPFYMQTTEVTQGQWKQIMGENRSYFKDCGDRCPVESISWEDAQEFINRLNMLEKTNKYQLPTEAQWEYACRAGSTTAFAGGEITRTECQDPVLDKMAWYCRQTTQPAALKEPNDWGLYDMHGNVWEWCRDGYRDYDPNPVVDPFGPPSSRLRINRGGSWYDSASYCRSAQRNWAKPTYYNNYIGFRVIRLN